MSPVRRCATHHLELDEASVVTRAGAILGGTMVCPAPARHRVRSWEVFVPGYEVVAVATHNRVTILRPEAFPPVLER